MANYPYHYENTVIIKGHVGKPPTMRTLRDNSAVCNLSVATNKVFKNRSGEEKTTTEWHYVTCYGALAEAVGKHFEKGDFVYVQGELRSRKFTPQDGSERRVLEIIAREAYPMIKRASAEQSSAPPAPTEEPPDPEWTSDPVDDAPPAGTDVSRYR